MIFSNSQNIDYFTVMTLIDSFVEATEATVVVNDDKLFYMLKRIEVPCINGPKNANVFKKLSAFLCEFVGEQIVESFECKMSDELRKIPNNGSAIIGFHIVTVMLLRATVQDGSKTIDKPLALSNHSYNDIIDSLNTITLSTSFKLVAVLLEQLVYKTNPELQYDMPSI